ncbi:hypothetical protein AOQ84DRAFT_374465 [Glonium stellatum]|uniref:Uncharacterized protein n=1 Tax=Glonium stellatum TaxID=574774 RepID=A0A8E2JVR1_9PEZI|nr:hypothetical protein AOQ84DRAFT_374465 [Glonium stellatum]
MSALLYRLLAFSFLLTLSSALSSTSVTLQKPTAGPLSTPLPPSQDPFYTAPLNYELAKPGTVLRIRAAPGNLTSVTSNSSAAYHILYRTTDTRYKPSWAVTTLFVPPSFSNTASPASNGTDAGSALLLVQF